MKQHPNDKEISELKNEINHNDNKKEILQRYESLKKVRKSVIKLLKKMPLDLFNYW